MSADPMRPAYGSLCWRVYRWRYRLSIDRRAGRWSWYRRLRGGLWNWHPSGWLRIP